MSATLTEINILAIPVFTLIGVLLTILATSKRYSRYFFTKEIMQKKFEAYENIYKSLLSINMATVQFFSTTKNIKTKKALKKEVGALVEPLLVMALLLDSNRLMLDDKVISYITNILVWPIKILGLNPSNKTYSSGLKELEIKFSEEYEETIEAILRFSGIKKADSVLRKINKHKQGGDLNYSEIIKNLKNTYKIK